MYSGLRLNKIYNCYSFLKGLLQEWNWLFISLWVCDETGSLHLCEYVVNMSTLYFNVVSLFALRCQQVHSSLSCIAFSSSLQISPWWKKQRFYIIMRIVLTSWNHWKNSTDHTLRTNCLQKRKVFIKTDNIM